MALVPARSNVLIDGISIWGVSDTTAADSGYSSIPFLRNGKISIDSLAVKDAKGQPHVYAYDMKASAEFLATRTQANFIDLLDNLGNDLIEHRITLVNGQIISSKPGTSTPSPTGFGTKWKVVSDKDLDDAMFIEMAIARRLTVAEYTQILTSANAPTFGTSATFTTITSLAATDICPAGISTIGFGVGSYTTNIISNLKSGKFTAELLAEDNKDSRGQPFGYGIKIDFECESMETKEAELLKWPALIQASNDVKLTFANGALFSAATALGIQHNYTIQKDSEGIATLKVFGSGIVANTGTIWQDLWS